MCWRPVLPQGARRPGGRVVTAAKSANQRNRPARLPAHGSLALLLLNATWPFEVWVPGRPAPQGSKRALGPGRMIEMSKYVDAWRTDVRAACLAVWQNRPPLDGPLLLEIAFVRARPASAPKRSTPSATSAPDLSKLLRSTEDAITSAGVWVDDSRVICTLTTKRVAEIHETPGANIRIGVPA